MYTAAGLRFVRTLTRLGDRIPPYLDPSSGHRPTTEAVVPPSHGSVAALPGRPPA